MKPGYLFFLLMLLSCSLAAQDLPQVIRQRSKAVVSISALSYSGEVVGRSNGFFISPDGILLMPSSLFLNSDSVVVTLFNGRKLGVERVISWHQYYNLSMVKVKGARDFEYLTPVRQTIREPEEVLVLVHESDGAVSEVGRLSRVDALPRLARMGCLDTRLGLVSVGAPVLDGHGGWIGLFFEDARSGSDCVLSALVMQDLLWVSVGLPVRQVRRIEGWRSFVHDDFLLGLMAFCWRDYGEGARRVALFLKQKGNDLIAYSARASMRMLYGNVEGFGHDVAMMRQLYPGDGMSFYLDGLQLELQGNFSKAMASFNQCCQLSPSFGAAYLSLGKLVLRQNNDIRGAFDLFSMALLNDSLLAQAYLERGKLLLQHSSNHDKAMADFHQCIYLDPSQEGVFTIRGTCFFDRGNYAAAIRDFDEALRRNPNDAHAWFNRGIAHYNVGLKDRACRDWEQASRLGNVLSYKYISRYCSGIPNSFH